jgi:transposase-like protein
MTHYSEELKASIIARMLPPQNASVPALAKETGIPKDTLYCWRLKARGRSNVGPERARQLVRPGSPTRQPSLLRGSDPAALQVSDPASHLSLVFTPPGSP